MIVRDKPVQVVNGVVEFPKTRHSPIPPNRLLPPGPMCGRFHELAGPV